MKRRNFFKCLALAAASVATGAAALPAAAVPVAFNPANYAEDIQWFIDPWPFRFDHDGRNWVPVHPFIEHKPWHARFNPAFTDAPYEARVGRRGKKEVFVAMFKRPTICTETCCQ